MTTDERLERLEKVLETLHEFALSRAGSEAEFAKGLSETQGEIMEAEAEFAKGLSETQGEIMEALLVLAEAVDKLGTLGEQDARGSLEAQHQHFKRMRDS